MKVNYLYAVIAIFALPLSSYVQKQEKISKVVIEGHISGFNNALSFWNAESNTQAQPDSAGNFKLEIEVTKAAFYTLGFGIEQRQQFYLKPGAEIQLYVDYNKLANKDRSAVRISGKGSQESELLYQLKINSSKFKYSKEEYREEYIPKVYDRTPTEYAKYMEEQVENDYVFIDKFAKLHPEVDANFVKNLKLNILIENNRDFQLYGSYQDMLKTGRTEVPENFDDYFADRIPQKDFELCKENQAYEQYVSGQYYSQVEKAVKDYPSESLDWYKATVAYLENCNFPKPIVQGIFDGFTVGYMRTHDEAIRAYLTELINKNVTDEKVLNRWKEFKAREGGYKDGDMAPNFTHKDINGKMVSLSDFRGKLVYIDLWATWCVPCLKGVPYFDKMRDKYVGKKIVFLAISLDENMEAWKKKVTENKDGLFDGIQINTGSYICDVSDNFVLNGIPQYVLIGADGRIIKKNAPDPYGEEIIELINSHLKNVR